MQVKLHALTDLLGYDEELIIEEVLKSGSKRLVHYGTLRALSVKKFDKLKTANVLGIRTAKNIKDENVICLRLSYYYSGGEGD